MSMNSQDVDPGEPTLMKRTLMDSLIWGLFWQTGTFLLETIGSFVLLGLGERTSNDTLLVLGILLFVWAFVSRALRPIVRRGFSASNHCKLASNFIDQGRLDEAIVELNAALALLPDCAMVYSDRAAAYAMKEDVTQAVKDAETAIRIDPTYAKAYVVQGAIQKNLREDYATAIESFEKAIQVTEALQSKQPTGYKEFMQAKEELMLKGAHVHVVKKEIEECKRKLGDTS